MAEEAAPITTTIKLGQGFEAPWVVLRANTPPQAESQLDWLSNLAYAGKLAQVTRAIQGVYNAAELTQPPQQQVAAPAQQYQAPPVQQAPADPWAEPAQQQHSYGSAAQAPQAPAQGQTYGGGGGQIMTKYGPKPSACQHGERKRYQPPSGDYIAWFCPLDRNDPNKCKPIYEA